MTDSNDEVRRHAVSLHAGFYSVQEELDARVSSERAHYADPQNLPRKLAETGRDLDVVLVYEPLAEQGFVETRRREGGSKMPDAVPGVLNQQFEPKAFQPGI